MHFLVGKHNTNNIRNSLCPELLAFSVDYSNTVRVRMMKEGSASVTRVLNRFLRSGCQLSLSSVICFPFHRLGCLVQATPTRWAHHPSLRQDTLMDWACGPNSDPTVPNNEILFECHSAFQGAMQLRTGRRDKPLPTPWQYGPSTDSLLCSTTSSIGI